MMSFKFQQQPLILKTSFIRVRENLRDSRMPRRREYFLHETIRYVWGILFDNLHLSC